MKQVIKKTILITIIFSLLSAFCVTFETSASQGSNMKKALKYYKAHNIKKAKKYNKRLPYYAKEKCVKNIPKRIKKAYKKKFKKLGYKAYEYYLTDVNNDNKADLLVLYGTREADFTIRYYTYKHGKVKYMAKTNATHSYFCAYSGHKGFISCFSYRNTEYIDLVVYKNKRLKTKTIGHKNSEPLLNPRCILKAHS